MEAQWTVEEAERKLPELIRGAMQGKAQFICTEGHAEAVVISANEWRNKTGDTAIQAPDLYLSACADRHDDESGSHPDKSFVEALLAIPQGDWDLEPCADTLKLRDADL